jgi:hypothetical protein
MSKKILILLCFCICTLFSYSQGVTIIAGSTKTNTVKAQGKLSSDSAFTPPADTLASAPIGSSAHKNGKPYVKDSTGTWVAPVKLDSSLYTTVSRLKDTAIAIRGAFPKVIPLNGLIKQVDSIKLGGSLTNNTIVNTKGKYLIFASDSAGADTYMAIAGAGSTGTIGLGTSTASLGIDNQGMTLSRSSGASTQQIAISGSTLGDGIVVTDQIESIGLSYNGINPTLGKLVPGWIPPYETVKSTIADSLTLPNGGPITSVPVIGFNPGTTRIKDWINNVFYASQPPTAALSGGLTYELKGSGTTNHNLTATIGRQSATQPIASAVITATAQNYPLTFSQPAQPGTVPVVQGVVTPLNATLTYTLTVTTTDGKVATATATDNGLPRRYFGFISDTTNIRSGAGGIDATIALLGSELSTSKSKSGNTGVPSGTQFFVYAYIATAGTLTQFDLNGFPSIDAMKSVSRSFTNGLGYTSTWYIYWTNNGQTDFSTYTAN